MTATAYKCCGSWVFQPRPVGLTMEGAQLPSISGDVGEQCLWWDPGSLLDRSVRFLQEGAQPSLDRCPATRAVPIPIKFYWFSNKLWQVGCSDDCRRSFCCPALNLVMLVFLNNVGKMIKYKLWYYAAVLCSGLDQCYYKLLQGASRPLSCIVSLFKINVFITVVLPQRILVLLLLAPSRKCLTDFLPFVKAHWSFVALKCAAFSL